jgi:hypothetical protein
MSSDRKKTDASQSVEQKRHESEEQLSLLQTITTELTTAEDLSSALEADTHGCQIHQELLLIWFRRGIAAMVS